MPNYFVIRTSDDEKEWIWKQLQEGRLRQGWGISGMMLPSGQDTPEHRREWCDRYKSRAKEFWQEEVSAENAESRYWILRQMLDNSR
jgi:hypothetical protein